MSLFACYALIAFACIELRPLWLDEVIQLIATTSGSIDEFMRSMGDRNPGAAPLGYLTQRPFVLAGGASALWARFPSLLFSILACWSLVRVCNELGMSEIRLLVAGLFMAIPLQFRYATEGRPYSQALCFSLLAMLAFLKMSAAPSARGAFLLVLATVVALYTQPYAILSVCGLVFWDAVTNAKSGKWKIAALGPFCMLVSVLAFLPWYLLETGKWASGIQQHGIPPFHWSRSLAMDVIKSISGDGFLCTAALIVLAGAGFASRSKHKGLLLSAILFSIGGALAGDALMNYFFASRQILFALPGLTILAATGFRELYAKNNAVAIAGLALLLGAAFQKDATMQMNAKENWQAAGGAVAEAARTGRCLEVVPADTLELYDFFAPGLAAQVCDGKPLDSGVVLVSHLYTPAAELASAENHLRDLGFVPVRTIATGGTTITFEDRRK